MSGGKENMPRPTPAVAMPTARPRRLSKYCVMRIKLGA